MDKQQILDKIRAILSGIDRTETEGGWWETSTGAAFGADVLQQIETLLNEPGGPDEPEI